MVVGGGGGDPLRLAEDKILFYVSARIAVPNRAAAGRRTTSVTEAARSSQGQCCPWLQRGIKPGGESSCCEPVALSERC